ncbi:hypothetical protein DI392_16575 [Vibrio albus]|uniref:Uncharacterized protein n=1 Tax=Vibrio albus TaxID=2200953 RepID=A0A2U3B659_9VIBR|nr:hypothetical protein [Vibrio albus]PWI32286.1 hypothetical protein DI392_16575 [Vibrio albus]
MAISSVQSGYSLMQQSQSLSNQAAQDIAQRTGNNNPFEQKQQEERIANQRAEEEQLTRQNDPNSATRSNSGAEQGMGFNQADKSEDAPVSAPKEISQSQVDSLLQLNQAQTYNQIGANVVQRSNDIVGTMLDTHV